MPRRKIYRRRTVRWRAVFLGEKGRPATVAEVDGCTYEKDKMVTVDQATKERLEALPDLQFEFEEVDR